MTQINTSRRPFPATRFYSSSKHFVQATGVAVSRNHDEQTCGAIRLPLSDNVNELVHVAGDEEQGDHREHGMAISLPKRVGEHPRV